METLKKQLEALPPKKIAGRQYLSYQAVTDTVAAFLFPHSRADQMEADAYQRLLETADALCRELGYREVVKLTPPDVTLADMGLYWSSEPELHAQPDAEPDPMVIHAGSGRVEMLEEGLLLDARLSQLGLDEVTRQHFKIPVTASDGVIDLMHRAVASAWPNDYRGIWHDLLGMCIAGGKDGGLNERLFTVIIHGLGKRRYWRFRAKLQQDNSRSPFLCIALADEATVEDEQLFPLGHVVMTPGAAALGVDFAPFLARHAQGDWGDELDAFDKQQNDLAVKEGYRILSAYNVPIGNGETERIWIITESDRSATTILQPREY
ncbi:MAG: hypothetical protein WAS33_22020 [Candidatus Promineifilaceae bacterium]